MATLKLAYVNSYRRYGGLHHQFRRKGFRRVTLRGKPGSAEFMAHYAELLAQSENAAAHFGATLSKPGSIDALIIKYQKHDAFTKYLSEVTQATGRRILDHFRDFKTPSGKRYGDARYSTMIDADIKAMKGRMPLAQDGWTKAIRHLVTFAAVQSKKDPDEFGIFAIRKDPTVGVTTDKPPKSDGHLTWGQEQIEQYRTRHPIGTMARLALELALNIAVRRHDVREIGRQHLRNGFLCGRPSKTSRTTGKVLTICVLPELQAALDALPQR